jgi:hypothetical protein
VLLLGLSEANLVGLLIGLGGLNRHGGRGSHCEQRTRNN